MAVVVVIFIMAVAVAVVRAADDSESSRQSLTSAEEDPSMSQHMIESLMRLCDTAGIKVFIVFVTAQVLYQFSNVTSAAASTDDIKQVTLARPHNAPSHQHGCR